MKSLREVFALFPNGLHDACLHELRVDLAKACVVLELTVDMSGVIDGDSGAEERGFLEMQQVDFIDLDRFCWPKSAEDGWRIDADFGIASGSQARFADMARQPVDVLWVFVSDMNSFIHISCREARWRKLSG